MSDPTSSSPPSERAVPLRAEQVRAEQVRLAFQHSPSGVITTLFVITFTTLGLWDVVHGRLLIVWLALALVISVYRLWLAFAFKRARPPDDAIQAWERRFIFSAALGGSIWAFAGLLMQTTDSATHHVLLMFIIGGMAAGAMSTLTPVLNAYRVYSIISITPLLIIWLLSGQQVFHFSGFMVIVYIFLILRSAANLNASIATSLGLGLENSALVHTLSQAKEHAEQINHELGLEVAQRKHEAEIRRQREENLRIQQQALFDLARYETLNEGDLASTLQDIAKTAAATLKAARSSIWVYEETSGGLRQAACFPQDACLPTHLPAAVCRPLHTALAEGLFLASSDIDAAPELWPLKAALQSQDTSALLSGSIRRAGRAVGVLCMEHRGGVRDWSLEEQNFTAALSEMAALALGQEHQRQVEEALFTEKEKAQVTVEAIGEGVITTDLHGTIEYINPVACQLSGVSDADALGQHLDDVLFVVREGQEEQVHDLFQQCIGMDKQHMSTGDLILVNRENGARSAVKITASAIKSRNHKVIGSVLIINDITELRNMARQMSYQATHDSLTGLMNRRAFEEHLRDAIATAKEEDKVHALLYMDLDQFKLVNDTCGHLAGDELLRKISKTLRGTLRASDDFARLGGDEFCAIANGCDMKNALRIAEKMRQAVCDFRFVWNERSFDLGISIGLVPLDGTSGDMAAMLSLADTACYVAKEQGRNRIHLYQADDEMISQRHGELHWIQEIKQALEDGRFVLYYQPAAALQPDPELGSYCEVLVRMLDRDGQLVPPMEFIPAAERYQLMPRIDRWVFKAALAGLNRTSSALAEFDVCAVNLSGQSLCDEQFLDFVLTGLRRAGVAPQRICFEITETAAIANIGKAMHFIATLKALGCRFALDDFGSGLSSFSYLKELAVDFLKIDGNFVKDMAVNEVDYAMVSAIHQMGHVLAKKTIAEFVEDQHTIALLQSLGVDYAQGYGIAKPQALREIEVPCECAD